MAEENIPSRPRAGKLARVAILLFLLALAVGAIWVIDRGAHDTAPVPSGVRVPPPNTDDVDLKVKLADELKVNLAEEFLHYTRVNSVEGAKKTGEQLLATLGNSPQMLWATFEKASPGRDFRAIVEAATHRDETKEIATKILEQLDIGRPSKSTRERIMADIEQLNKGVRAYHEARERLAAAGQDAVLVMIEVLQDEKKKDLHPDVFGVMVELGQSANLAANGHPP